MLHVHYLSRCTSVDKGLADKADLIKYAGLFGLVYRMSSNEKLGLLFLFHNKSHKTVTLNYSFNLIQFNLCLFR